MKFIVLIVISIVSTIFAEPLTKGEKAPHFSLIDENGVKHSLSDFKNKKPIILIFYPGDNTPRCTKQLCELRDNYEKLISFDSTAVFGINDGNIESHKKFSSEHRYQFPLLTDSNSEVAELYGVKGKIQATKRYVFIIDKKGMIKFAKKGKPPVEAIIDVLSSLE